MTMRWRDLFVLGTALLASGHTLAAPAPLNDNLIVDAREALRKSDRVRLAALRAAALDAQHPLAQWADYWDLSNRLPAAAQPEIDAFYARWPGTYVEDRLRNDWLLELGKRRDWAAFSRDHARFRMNDDREVGCYALLTQHLAGQDVTQAARAAWFAQRDADDGCDLLATTLVEARRFTPADVWQELRLSIEFNRPRAAKAASALAGAAAAQAVAELVDKPARYLARRAPPAPGSNRQLAVLAVMRLAGTDPGVAAAELAQPWALLLPPELAAVAWAAVGKQSALRLEADAPAYFQRAFAAQRKSGELELWTDDTLAWAVRAALRSSAAPQERWSLVANAIDAMSDAEQKDPAWVYWKARALQGRAVSGPRGDEARAAARQLLESIASPLHFYGLLASEDLGQSLALPGPPAALSTLERALTSVNPGLNRALQMIALGLRNEGVREWNFSLRGLGERELLAAAQLACDHEVWDRCINTSERTRAEVDLAQRYPTPFRDDVVAASNSIGLDPAYVYGLIRQESRFIMDARSSVGASGLMQLMPATARWTAKRIGLPYSANMIADRDVNLKLGTSYLKLVLDDFDGSAALATAAYNAGPSRSRRWREGALQEAAAWAEGIPFNETRDYVKKVLSNATVYSALLNSVPVPALKTRLGATIGPREATTAPPDKDLP
ncbi:MAG TPA: transglycosylase SLT domain-containing protein [Rubrivivax sp.]